MDFFSKYDQISEISANIKYLTKYQCKFPVNLPIFTKEMLNGKL